MHIPTSFKENNEDTLYQFIKEFSLGTLISPVSNEVDAIHVPFYLHKKESGEITLQSHLAKVNSFWKKSNDGDNVLIIFHGPNAYISPNYYPSKSETGKAVPTWNYSVVHVKGRIYFKHEKTWILEHLENLTNFHESKSQTNPWSISDAPEDFTNKLLSAVVGIEVNIDNITGNFKLSQNKISKDYAGVLNGLNSSDNQQAQILCEQMRSTNKSS